MIKLKLTKVVTGTCTNLFFFNPTKKLYRSSRGQHCKKQAANIQNANIHLNSKYHNQQSGQENCAENIYMYTCVCVYIYIYIFYIYNISI